MYLLVCCDEVRDTIEMITAIPKLHLKKKEFHHKILKPVVEYFIEHRIDFGETTLARYEMFWDRWRHEGIVYDESGEWFIKAIDLCPDHAGIKTGPRWEGIKCIQSPITKFHKGYVEKPYLTHEVRK